MLNIDLNLLRVFDMLMEQRSVTRAAQRLGLTQSAVSHALRRLREHLGDPLFVRGPGGLRPTPRAIDMAVHVRGALVQLGEALSQAPFDPASSTRSFAISAGSYFSIIFFPEIISLARAQAPHISFHLFQPSADLKDALESGQVDMTFGEFGRIADRLNKEFLFHEELIWIAAANSLPPGHRSTMADIAGRPRLEVVAGPHRVVGQDFLSSPGLEQRASITSTISQTDIGEAYITVHDTMSAMALVSASDLVALVPSQIVSREAQRHDLRIIKPRTSQKVSLSMLWHSRAERDPAHLWLRELVRAASRRFG